MCFVIAELLLAPSLEHWHAKSVLEDSQDLKSKSPVVPEKAGCLAGCLIPSHQASLKKPMSQEGRKRYLRESWVGLVSLIASENSSWFAMQVTFGDSVVLFLCLPLSL